MSFTANNAHSKENTLQRENTLENKENQISFEISEEETDENPSNNDFVYNYLSARWYWLCFLLQLPLKTLSCDFFNKPKPQNKECQVAQLSPSEFDEQYLKPNTGKIVVKNNRYYINQGDFSEKQPEVSQFNPTIAPVPNKNATVERRETPLKSSLKEHGHGSKPSKNKVGFYENNANSCGASPTTSKSHDFNPKAPISSSGNYFLLVYWPICAILKSCGQRVPLINTMSWEKNRLRERLTRNTKN